MKPFLTAWLCCIISFSAAAQYRVAIIGSSTSAGLGATTYDSSWVARFNQYYKRNLGVVDTVHNLAVSGTTVYRGMPSSYTPPAGRPTPDTAKNISKALRLLAGFGRNGAVIVNFPTNGYDNYTIPEILSRLQAIYDTATAAGHRCFITTTQPRSDGNFATAAVKAKLAALKDSIINRFGIASTLNFWDGVYNPADTTILTAYSAGDNVHLNNAGHRELFSRVLAKNIFAVNPAVTGDYRSNVSPTGLWSAAASWEVFNGTAWVTASAPPDSSSGTIRILAGDSIRVNSATTLDQVIVDTGAVLTFFNLSTPTSFTLTNGPGEDLLVYGRLYVSTNASLAGAGTLSLTPNALFTLRNFGTLAVNTLNEGLARTTGTGVIQAAMFTNNGTFQHVEYSLNLNNGATFVNNDSLALIYASDSYFGASTGSGSLINSAGAVMYKSQPTGIAYVNASVSFTNAGAVKGVGQYVIQNIAANGGAIAPGASPGILAVNPGMITGKTPLLQLEITGSGAVAGTSYDQLQLTNINTTTTSLSGTRLELRNTGTDPVNTVYTLISSAGTITGAFASLSIPSNFGNLSYNGSSVTIEKIAATPLPLGLLRFEAWTEAAEAKMEWELAPAARLADVWVERSADAAHFEPVAQVPQEAGRSAYAYSERKPGAAGTCFYRLRLATAGGQAEYSAVRSLRYGTGSLLLSAGPNPVSEQLKLALSAEPVTARLLDATGRVVRELRLAAGAQTVGLGDVPGGVYLIEVRTPDGRQERLRIVRR